MLKTVEGEPLTFEMKDGKLWIIDAKGDTAQVTIAQRHAVERRHPRHRHRAVAGLIRPHPPARALLGATVLSRPRGRTGRFCACASRRPGLTRR